MFSDKLKIWIIVFGIAFLIIILGIFLKNPPDNNLEETEDGVVVDFENPQIDARQLCYIWNTEAGDKAMLSMDIRAGKDVIGEFYWLPHEKDSKKGIFRGVAGPLNQKMMARTMDGWWEVEAEGMKSVEQIKIIFGDGTANVGFGEMTEDEQGRWIYADSTKLSYEPNLSQTDCGDEAMD